MLKTGCCAVFFIKSNITSAALVCIDSEPFLLFCGDYCVQLFLKYIRRHWLIENQLHWMLDIVFREDKCRVQTRNAKLNLNILRKAAIGKPMKLPLKKKRGSAKRA